MPELTEREVAKIQAYPNGPANDERECLVDRLIADWRQWERLWDSLPDELVKEWEIADLVSYYATLRRTAEELVGALDKARSPLALLRMGTDAPWWVKDLLRDIDAALAHAAKAGVKVMNCTHERLNEEGICRSCGADKRGIGESDAPPSIWPERRKEIEQVAKTDSSYGELCRSALAEVDRLQDRDDQRKLLQAEIDRRVELIGRLRLVLKAWIDSHTIHRHDCPCSDCVLCREANEVSRG